MFSLSLLDSAQEEVIKSINHILYTDFKRMIIIPFSLHCQQLQILIKLIAAPYSFSDFSLKLHLTAQCTFHLPQHKCMSFRRELKWVRKYPADSKVNIPRYTSEHV